VGQENDNQAMPAVGRRTQWLLGVTVLVVSLAGAAWLHAKDKVFLPPVANHANTYPAHEQQQSEHLTIAADPYDMPDKAAIFAVKYKDAGFLPVLLVVSNDGDQPISLANIKVELITVDKEKLEAAEPEQIHRRIAKLSRPDQGPRISLPLPLPSGRPKSAVSKEAKEEIEAAQFKVLAVEPKTTRSGFFFFDIDEISNPLAGARLYVSGLRNANGHEILYFEIPMEKYLTYQPPKP
jgi:hypothetical protein